MRYLVVFLSLALLLISCDRSADRSNRDGTDASAPGAPLFDDLGSHTYPISTTDPLVQRFFDQGLILAYGFNHAEAARAFREASRLDPDCAMCEWGLALVLGPNINKAMDDADVSAAYEASQRALEKSAGGTDLEQALIQSLTQRYAPTAVEDRSGLDRAYADAMAAVAEQFPDDLDTQVLYAEALMNLMPWDYYLEDGTPRPETDIVVATIESVLTRAPDHPGAIHFYIHAVEATETPQRAEPFADTLRSLVPGAGHLVHMPAHIYLRVGRYADASLANELAAAADESYIAQCKAQGFYPATYYPHNVHFLWYSSSMEGRRETSVEAAERLYANLPIEEVEQFIEVEYFIPIPLFARVRFADWNAVFEAPAPDEALPYARAMWHYAQGAAHAALGDPEQADSHLASLMRIRDGEAIQTREIPFVMGASLSSLAADDLAGRIAMAQGDGEAAVAHFKAAIVKEDAVPYVEPPYWYYPVRQQLGALLMELDRPEEAEAVYRRDLQLHPHNGWSLYGLSQALAAQGKNAEAGEAENRFREVWQAADVELEASIL